MSTDAEKQALLATGVPAGGKPEMAAPAGNAAKVAPREWRFRWWALFGDCSAPDVVSCLLAWKLPFVAWSWNQHRSLGLSFWRELLRFVALTVGFALTIQVACCAVMVAMCPEARAGDDISGMRKMLHMHHHDDDDTTDGPRHHHHHDMWADDGPDGPHGIPKECIARVAPAYIALAALVLALFVYAAVFLARRRTAIRERYGIDGTRREDCLLYTFCAPCALAQETRTLMHEQVHDGIWYGALPGVAPASIPAVAPPPQKMVV